MWINKILLLNILQYNFNFMTKKPTKSVPQNNEKEKISEKSQAANQAMEQIKNKFGDGAIMKFGEVRKTDVDAEHALDPEYAKNIGVNIDELLISQPDTGEQALEILETLVRSNAVDVVVVDSVAALVPRKEIEGEMGDQHMGLQARLMSQALRKLTGIVSKTKTIVIFINQIRHKIGVFFGSPETTSGGNALKFYSSVRIDVRRSAQIKQGEKIIGNRVKAKIVKNKVAAPFRACEFDIMYNEGISVAGDILDTGVLYGVINKSGNSYTFEENKLGVGRENAKITLRGDKKIQTDMFVLFYIKTFNFSNLNKK